MYSIFVCWGVPESSKAFQTADLCKQASDQNGNPFMVLMKKKEVVVKYMKSRNQVSIETDELITHIESERWIEKS